MKSLILKTCALKLMKLIKYLSSQLRNMSIFITILILTIYKSLYLFYLVDNSIITAF